MPQLGSRLFLCRLAARLIGLAGAASLAAPLAACGDGGDGGGLPGGLAGTGTATGTGDAVGTGSGPTMGSAVGPSSKECFAWAPDMGACPTNAVEALAQFTCCGCPTGWEPKTIDSPPMASGGNECCYLVTLELCALGGRPYVVGDTSLVAPAARGAGPNGWTQAHRPCLDGLSDDERAALAEAWTADALLEHASVASFSRFSLALLAAGAPADLVELSHRAALDEIRHAGLCFALASAYAGEDIAPGPFPLGGGVSIGASLVEIVVSTIREGCVGETVAAAIAAEQLARAVDPAVRAALEEIAFDEARHAELAWKTVAWAVRSGGDQVRVAAARAFVEALDGSRTARDLASGGAAARPMEAHGRLDAATVAEVAAAAMADVVAPAAWTLLRSRAAPRDMAAAVPV